ncbi:thioesterase II family protein [Chitinophaga qingshengii]|uniref:Thioesterase n=1 Tax=Chitinophaga qingshengii TaxID=1569794 RepID=A0ABR7TWN6_9BACT|nr:alpha/beta fold hydrolase [Chitinophaga qingshengii]MBC9934896.1 thioesterase [Chitinophaga qingshengii]
MNLFCFPFAGGGKHSYNGYKEYAPADLYLWPLELPGRGARVAEPLITDIHLMAEDLWQQLKHQIRSPYAFYGHSMGSLLAYLVVHKIIGAGLTPPRYLFLTGCKAPSLREPKENKTHLLPGGEFWKKVVTMDGLPEPVLKDQTFITFFEPILRADFQAVETFTYNPLPPFNIPMMIVTGTEEDISMEEMKAWEQETTASVVTKQLPGKHFFILKHEREIMQMISRCLKSSVTFYS